MSGDERLPAFSKVCAVVSAVSLLFAADFVFFKLSTFEDLSKVIKVAPHALSVFVYDYGRAVWGIMLVATVLAWEQAFRRPLEKRTQLFNIVVALITVAFTFLLHYAVWNPVREFLVGLGGLSTSP